MDKNLAYRRSLQEAGKFLAQANHCLLELKLLKVNIRQDNVQKDYYEQILSINTNVSTENLSGYLQGQKSILQTQMKFDNKIRELSSLISFALIYALEVMDDSIDNSEIDLVTKSESKSLFYKSINFIESNRIEKIIDLNSILPIFVKLDLKVADAGDTNKKNIQNRLRKLKQIITRQ